MIHGDRVTYRWRRMTAQQREEVRQFRQACGFPFHSPPHYDSDCGLYLITAACYEHKPVIGRSPQRMGAFENELLVVLGEECPTTFSWIVLPNHYHALVESRDVKRLLRRLGRLHGRTSFEWNGEERCRGRKVWFNAAETAMKSEGHFWATMNYVLHNAVRHGYVDKWTDWPYSNAQSYLAELGRNEATRIWKQYPIRSYGRDWDPPEM